MGKRLLLMGVVLAGPALFYCLPPPPELQEARERRALKETNKNLTLPRIHTIYMGVVQYNDNYIIHLLKRGLLVYGIDALEGNLMSFYEKDMVEGMYHINQEKYLSAYKEFGFSVYRLEGAELADLAVILHANLPIVMRTKKYCRIGATGDGHASRDDPKDYLKVVGANIYGRHTLLVGFDGYNPQNPNTGYIQYFGYKLQKMRLTEFRDKKRFYHLPVRSDSTLAALQDRLKQYHDFHQLEHSVPAFVKIL